MVCSEREDYYGSASVADQLEADGLALSAAQAEIARMTAALATAMEDGMREAMTDDEISAALNMPVLNGLVRKIVRAVEEHHDIKKGATT